MKGVILAGGTGRRLHPLTKITNKHLLPVYRKPMIYYPIEMLVDAGIRDIMIVTGGDSAGDFLKLIGSGKGFGLAHVHYMYQEGETGIAAALALAEEFVEDDKVVVVLGDNFLQKGLLQNWVRNFEAQERGARIFLKETDNPSDYGVPEFKNGKMVRMHEKPEHPPCNLANIGVFMYPPDVFGIIRDLRPAASGELEITDVNNVYIEQDRMEFEVVEGWWEDAGDSPEGLLRASVHVARAEGVMP